MGRRPKGPFKRSTSPCAVDAAFMLRLAEALGISSLSDNACTSIDYTIYLRNIARPDIGKRRGRPLNLSIHILVDGLLDILEEDGIKVTVNKREGRSGNHNNGRIADFLRVIWDALKYPDLCPDSFARLAADCSPVLGATMDERRDRRAERRAPRATYIEELSNSWKR